MVQVVWSPSGAALSSHHECALSQFSAQCHFMRKMHQVDRYYHPYFGLNELLFQRANFVEVQLYKINLGKGARTS